LESPTTANPTPKPKGADGCGGCLGALLFVGLLGGIFIGLRAWEDAHTSTLWQAARDGDLAGVRRAVEGGEGVSQTTGRHAETPLHAAAGRGDVSMAMYLLEKGARVDVVDVDGYTPLHACARYNAKGGPPRSTEAGRNEVARMLLDHGAAVNARTYSIRATALHDAAFEDNVGLVELLLARGADANAATTQGMTPLHYATFAGSGDDPRIAELLLAHGASPHARDVQGTSPLDNANRYAPRVAQALGRQGASEPRDAATRSGPSSRSVRPQ